MNAKSLYLIPLFILCYLISFGSINDKNPTPNILLVTVDDMNWNSVGAYGCTLNNITPNIDQLAQAGKVFNYAYVQSPNCSPSRGVIQSGMYPHSSGMRGFYYVDFKHKSLPEVLADNGYFTAVINKATDTSLSPKMLESWDLNKKFKSSDKRNAQKYEETFNEVLNTVKKEQKPFYCVINIADPHKLFFNDPGTKKESYVDPLPSYIYEKKEIVIPPFLPQHPKVKQEVTNYYNSVKRADDCFGAVMKVLDEQKMRDNTLIIFLSDHGMALPFAKTSLYQNGVRTPWIMSWKGKIKEDSKEEDYLVSAVDLMPTILDILNIKEGQHLQGQSFKKVLEENKSAKSDKYVVVEYNENAGGIPRPMRGVINQKYNYVFNPWATGKYTFKSAAQSHTSYKVMKKMSETDPAIKARYDYLNKRTLEEFYDLEKDPEALNNLIDDPAYQDVIKEMQAELMAWMEKTDDYLLEAFENKSNVEFLNKVMAKEIKDANQRAATLKWKRFKNSAGGTGKHTALYKMPSK